MFSISNEELKYLPYAVDLADENGEFEIIHTNKDNSVEVCTVSSGEDDKGNKLWSIGHYTTKEGKTYLAVVAGKVLKNIVLKT